ncbi:MAG: hypothetical protein WC807_05545 [Hyphomicrobium sp.]|jgi:hypothetical protein
MTLSGRSSRTESILFYTRGADELPEQLIREKGPYEFTLTASQAEEETGLLPGTSAKSQPVSISFTRSLPFYDARAFDTGTIFMHAEDWQASSSKSGK